MLEDLLFEYRDFGVELLILGVTLHRVGNEPLDAEVFLDGLAQEFFSLLCLDRRVEVLFLNGRVDSQGVSELLKQRLLPRAGYVLDLLEHLFDLVVLFFEQFKGVHRCLRKGLDQVGDVAAVLHGASRPPLSPCTKAARMHISFGRCWTALLHGSRGVPFGKLPLDGRWADADECVTICRLAKSDAPAFVVPRLSFDPRR